MGSRRPDPFEGLFDLHRALDDSWFQDWIDQSTSGRGAYPPINVFQRGDDLVVIAELPGVAKEELEIAIERNQLRIAGRKGIAYGDDISIHRRERKAGGFDRSLALPTGIDVERVRADYQDGVLTLILPRAEADRARTIRIA